MTAGSRKTIGVHGQGDDMSPLMVTTPEHVRHCYRKETATNKLIPFQITRIVTNQFLLFYLLIILLLFRALPVTESSSQHAEGRDSKLEDVWRALPSIRHVRYNTNVDISNKTQITYNRNVNNSNNNNLNNTSSNKSIYNHNNYNNLSYHAINCSVINVSSSEPMPLVNLSDWLVEKSKENQFVNLLLFDNVNCTFYNTKSNRKAIGPILADIINFNRKIIDLLKSKALYINNNNISSIVLLNRKSRNVYNNKLTNETDNIRQKLKSIPMSHEDSVVNNSIHTLTINELVSIIKSKIMIDGVYSPNYKNLTSSEENKNNNFTNTAISSSSSLILSIIDDSNVNFKGKGDEISNNVGKKSIDSDEDDKEKWSIVDIQSTQVKNSTKSSNDESVQKINNSDNVKHDENLLNGFITNSLSDLRSPEYINHNLIVSSQSHSSLDDLILHHTGSSGVIHNPPTKKRPSRPRPSVILIQDVPDELLPKPPPDYQTTTPFYQYLPATTLELSTITPSPTFQHYEPIAEPQYVPIINKPKPQKPFHQQTVSTISQSQVNNNLHKPQKPVNHYPKPVSEPFPEPETVPIYHNKPHKPIIKPNYDYNKNPEIIQHVPIYNNNNNKPVRPVSNPSYEPIHFVPVPEPEPIHHVSTSKPTNKPVHYDPVSNSHPVHHGTSSKPSNKPIYHDPFHTYQIFKPEINYHPAPQPNLPINNRPVYDETRPVYPSSTAKPITNKKPAHYYTTGSPIPVTQHVTPTVNPPVITQPPPLGPTLIFVNPPVTSPPPPLRPADPPPSPSPLNPITIPSGRPPPSIVLLPPLSDSVQSSPVCPSVYVTNHQTIHTSADFKDECSGNVNVIINAPVEVAAGGQSVNPNPEEETDNNDVMPISNPEEEEEDEDDEDDDDDDNGPSDDEQAGGGASAIIPASIVAAGAGAGAAAGTAAAGGAGAGGAAAAAASAAAAGAGAAGAGSGTGAGSPVTSHPIQNDLIAATTVAPIPTKRPSTSGTQNMSVFDYFGSLINSFVVYPLWTVFFAPFSLLLASGLGVAALVFPWAFPRFWFGRRRRRLKRSILQLEYQPIVSTLHPSASIFEKKLKLNYNFENDFNR